jgi:hypothetical protein
VLLSRKDACLPHCSYEQVCSIGIVLSPVHFRRPEPRQVSCYAFFKWWLLLSLHPCCLWFKTTFDYTEHKFRDLNCRLPFPGFAAAPYALPPILILSSIQVLSWKEFRRQKPLQTLSVLYLVHKQNKTILRHISTGTSHRRVRVAFHP